MKEANTLHTGRIKESQLFLTTQLRLLKCYPVSAILVDFFILMHIFNVSFDLLLLFFSPFYFSSFQSHSSSGFMKNAMFMCLSPSVILPASVMTFTDVSLCLCPSPSCCKALFLFVRITFTKACPSLPQRDSISVFFTSLVRIGEWSRCQLCILQHLPNISGTDRAFAAEALPTQHFYMATKQCNSTLAK